eukprot:TRINITY_DN35811_c0_g1_i1.p1 TRINITY_DN35811_c0_g1~~TRINITY_DN35811_c0_g1_i1.p1  ORF type:complete len:437 (+),score=75.21 TRINITY_DN35811_c0_g1_i1:54-1364(+)
MGHGYRVDGACRLGLILCLLSSSFATRSQLPQDKDLYAASHDNLDVQTTTMMEGVVADIKAGGHETAAVAGKGSLLFIIGDSHGDKNYLVRCLLATGLFKLDQASNDLVWNPGMHAETNFEVVVLGDFIDRGIFSRQCALLLKALSEHETWGSHLVVLMGNHESMMLRYRMKYAQEAGWSEDSRHEDLKSTEGSQQDLIVWMRKRPVVHLSQSVLMMHGGLSKSVATTVLEDLEGDECQTPGPACGAAAMDLINAKASEHFERVHRCVQGSRRRRAKDCDEDMGGRPYVIGGEKDKNLAVRWSSSGGGVLWFRGYSKMSAGAGTQASCDEAVEVGAMFGAQAMAVAHTTHVKITEYCDGQVPVFACDTHYTDCTKENECDFDTDFSFHDTAINQTAENVPQTLKVEKLVDGSRKFSRCLSRVTKSAEVIYSCYDIL